MGDAEIIPIGHAREARPRHRRRQAVLQQPQPGRQGHRTAVATRVARRRRASVHVPREPHARRRRRRGPRPSPEAQPRSATRPDRRRPQGSAWTSSQTDRARPSRPRSPTRAAGHRPTTVTPAPASRRWSGSRPSPRASKELFGENWEPRLAEFLAFLRRRLTGDFTVDDYGFDREVTEQFLLAALRPIAQKWFRIEVRGAENIPTEGGALVVSNHSGTVPVDGLMTAVSIHDHTGRFLRPLGADLVFKLPIVGDLARKGGATLACNEDAERMLRGGELVGRLARGLQGHRQAVQRALQAAAVRPRRLRLGGHPHRRTHHPDLGRRRRGDLPARRQHPLAGPAARACPTCRSRRSSRCSARSA